VIETQISAKMLPGAGTEEQRREREWMEWKKGQNAISRLQIAKRLSDGWMLVG